MAQDVPGSSNSRDSMLFQHILLMLQTLALQQLGKITNPISGKMERDLQQARITIDMLGMLQRMTAGNLEDKEKRLLDTVVLELQMNFVDESGRKTGDEEERDGTEDDGPPGEIDPGEAGEGDPGPDET